MKNQQTLPHVSFTHLQAHVNKRLYLKHLKIPIIQVIQTKQSDWSTIKLDRAQISVKARLIHH